MPEQKQFDVTQRFCESASAVSQNLDDEALCYYFAY